MLWSSTKMQVDFLGQFKIIDITESRNFLPHAQIQPFLVSVCDVWKSWHILSSFIESSPSLQAISSKYIYVSFLFISPTSPWHHTTISSWYHIIMVSWHRISMETYHHGTMSPWQHTPWYYISNQLTTVIHDGTLSPWCCLSTIPGIVTPWHHVTKASQALTFCLDPWIH